jgi:hypothetical protein
MDFDLAALPALLQDALGAKTPLSACSAEPYARMQYPKLLPFMRFTAKKWRAEAFGSVFCLSTRAMGGKMQLCTFVCTPNLGTDLPVLLIDAMRFGKKRAAFVEYYDCTAHGAIAAPMQTVSARYRDLPDYAEKPAWYIASRTPYSLIKGGEDDARLEAMLAESVKAYGEAALSAKERRPENLAGLSRFADRMVREGNPSSATMGKVLGRAGAETFFRTAVMPVSEKE